MKKKLTFYWYRLKLDGSWGKRLLVERGDKDGGEWYLIIRCLFFGVNIHYEVPRRRGLKDGP